MTAIFEAWLDEERQIIRQRMHGDPDLEQFKQLIQDTDACVRRLRCPTDVRILVDGSGLGRMAMPVRREAQRIALLPDLTRMALFGVKPVARILIRFLCVATGVAKMRTFSSEAEALQWLLS
jgi:hypothetical protein